MVANAVELAILGVLIGAALVVVVCAVVAGVAGVLGRCLRRGGSPTGSQRTFDA